jgi:CRISPR system Cascade subunit CasA
MHRLKATFDLIEQPWIPCRFLNGETNEVGLKELFLRATDIAEISGDTPLEEASLYRFLVALTHRIVQGPSSEEEWETLWLQGHFKRDQVEDYFEKWKDRFDLFHPEFPFFQHPGCAVIEETPLSKIVHSMASGNNPVLFDHHYDDINSAWPPATGARRLLAAQYYSFGGLGPSYQKKRVSFFQASLVRGAIAILQGENLFETLALNLVVIDGRAPIPGAGEKDDLPIWEKSPDHFEPAAKRIPKGYLDYLTWRSRLMLLSPDEEGRVKAIRWIQGDQIHDVGLGEPMMIFRLNEAKSKKNARVPTGWIPLKFHEGRSFWRDSSALAANLEAADKKGYRPPETIRALATREGASSIICGIAKVQLYGILPDPKKAAKPLLWRKENLPLPLAYLREDRLYTLLTEALKLTESVATEALGYGIRVCGKEIGSPLPKETRREAKKAFLSRAESSVITMYWTSLEIPFMETFLRDIAERDPGTVLQDWKDQLTRCARYSFEMISESLEGKADGLRAWTIGKQAFEYGLAKALGFLVTEGGGKKNGRNKD